MSIGKAANDNVVPAFGPFPPTMAIAKALGSKYYFTGKPCKWGHVAARYAHGSCTQCKADQRERNRETTRTYLIAWRAARTEKPPATKREMEFRKAYYLANKEQQIANAVAWRAANPERQKETTRRWLEANKDVIKQKNHIRYVNRSEADRERAAVNQRNIKAKRRAAEGRHTLYDIQEIIERQKSKCAECGTSILVAGYHVDHIMPLALGGSNWPSNLQVLCPPCNQEKHAMHPIDFARKKGRLL